MIVDIQCITPAYDGINAAHHFPSPPVRYPNPLPIHTEYSLCAQRKKTINRILAS